MGGPGEHYVDQLERRIAELKAELEQIRGDGGEFTEVIENQNCKINALNEELRRYQAAGDWVQFDPSVGPKLQLGDRWLVKGLQLLKEEMRRLRGIEAKYKAQSLELAAIRHGQLGALHSRCVTGTGDAQEPVGGFQGEGARPDEIERARNGFATG
jgi:hypothetical protein